METKEEYTTTELAKQIGVTLGRVSQLHKEGVLTRLPNGRYPAWAITQYIKFIRTLNEKSDYGEKIEKEKYREIKRRNDLEEKEVAPVSLITEALEKIANMIIPILESLPLIVKRNWPEITGDQAMLIKKAVAECLNSIDSVNIKVD